MEPAILQAIAPAKLNLSLHVLGKRADGYHDLESIVAFAAYGDALSFAPAETLQLRVTGEFADEVGDTDSNLVIRAAQALRAYANETRGAAITLEKRIPVGAGLGGGSSDAATTLQMLRALWGLAVSDVALMDIAETLGADVPMCLHAKPLLAEGRGEIITPLPYALPTFYVVLVYPNQPLATKDVFGAYRAEAAPPVTSWVTLTTANVLPALQRAKNTLQHAAVTQCAAVGEILLTLQSAVQQPDLVRMSGSGSCCFALCDEESRALRLAEDIKKRYPQWWVASSVLLR